MNSLPEIYDKFADIYEANRDTFDISSILHSFYKGLECTKGTLLDLGCGTGEPVARFFIDNQWQVTGVDFSKRMIELASKYAPEMEMITNDFRNVQFGYNHFDAVTATYSLFHIPSENQANLFAKIFQWLKPKGKFLFTYATKEYTGSDIFSGYKTFMGHDLYYSHKTPDEVLNDLQHIGFTIETSQYHTICDETFLWITVQKPDTASMPQPG